MARATTNPPPSQPIDGATVVGPGIRISGRVTGEEDLHVEGRIDGAIQLSDTLFVAPGGIVAAEVEAHNVVVSGVIVGNVTARDCVTLHTGAKLVGDITAPRLVIADGAAFKGNVRMGGEVAPAREKSRSVARPRPVATGLRGVAAANRGPAAAAAARPARVPPRPAARAQEPSPPPRAPARAADAPRSDDDDTVIVWATAFDPYLVELAFRSPDLRFAEVIGVTQFGSRVYAKFDAVTVAGFRYPIASIYKISREEARNFTRGT